MNRMMACLFLPMRERLDALVAVGEDDTFSALNRIKAISSKASPAGMGPLLAKLELIEDAGVLEVDINWINANHQRFLFHSARTMSVDRLGELIAPRTGSDSRSAAKAPTTSPWSFDIHRTRSLPVCWSLGRICAVA